MMNISFLLLFLIAFSLQSYSQVTVKIWKCNEIVYPVTPNQPNDYTELIPIEKLFNDKKIIGMGEATHGTREFFNMKAKMFKFLATRCGYRVFSIEATYGGTLKVNDYVLYGKGDVLSAMKGMEFWTCNTEEVKDLIEWMRTYNMDLPDNEKLKFYGFDCQSFQGPKQALLNYVEETDKQNLDEFSKNLSLFNDSVYRYFHTAGPGKDSNMGIDTIYQTVTFLGEWFKEKEEVYISAGGKVKYEVARHNIETLKQALLLAKNPFTGSNTCRDSCMAQNILWINELENTKVFVWAHNGHISKAPISTDKKGTCMGMNLKKMFGDNYYNIGFVFNQGSFQAFGKEAEKVQEFSVPEYKKNTITNELSLTGINAFFIDLTATNNKLFTTSGHAYYIGAGFVQGYWETYSKPMIAKKQFDGLIFINSTNCAVPIKGRLTN